MKGQYLNKTFLIKHNMNGLEALFWIYVIGQLWFLAWIWITDKKSIRGGIK